MSSISARRAAETALLAAPYEDIPSLDLAAVARAEGDLAAAHLLLTDLCDRRSDDPAAPDDLPARTDAVLDRHPDWLQDPQQTARAG